MSNVVAETRPQPELNIQLKPTINKDKLYALLYRKAESGGLKIENGKFIINSDSGTTAYKIDPETIRTASESDCETIFEIITRTLNPTMLYTFTRVIGYYSSTENWNLSKLGELEDRRRGGYALPEI
jgi:hypothetical protein